MYKELSTLAVFFDDPQGEYQIREVARITKLSPMTVRAYLNKFAKGGLLIKKETKLFPAFIANTSNQEFRNLKLYYNLERLRVSKVIADLEQSYDYPTIVLFGSYASATNTKESDIDLCVITNIPKDFNINKYTTLLKRAVSIHKFSEKEFKNMKTKNPELVNNICNGIKLSGKLEVV